MLGSLLMFSLNGSAGSVNGLSSISYLPDPTLTATLDFLFSVNNSIKVVIREIMENLRINLF